MTNLSTLDAIPLPDNAVYADIWEDGQRVVIGDEHTLTNCSRHKFTVRRVGYQDSTGAVRWVVAVDDIEFDADQVRELIAVLSAAQVFTVSQ